MWVGRQEAKVSLLYMTLKIIRHSSFTYNFYKYPINYIFYNLNI